MTRDNEILANGRKAWQAFEEGWARGQWNAYTALLSTEMEFSFPVGPFRGKYFGREGYEKMLAKIASDSQTGYRLTFTVRHVSQNADTVLYEYEAEGNLDGYAYKSCNAIAFQIRAGKIAGYREYFGDIDVAMFIKFAELPNQ